MVNTEFNFDVYYIDCVVLELYTTNCGGANLKRNYIWGYTNKRGRISLVCTIMQYVFSANSAAFSLEYAYPRGYAETS
jgi:hypothetical protein